VPVLSIFFGILVRMWLDDQPPPVQALLARAGPLLVPLQDQAFFERFFIDAGALCWPHGLDLSPDHLREQVQVTVNA